MSTSDELSPPSSASLPKSHSGGALKLLDDLAELASLLGTDISKPRVWKSSKSETQTITEETQTQQRTITRVDLSKVYSTRGGESLQQAIDSGRLDTLTGYYKDVGGISQKLADELEKEEAVTEKEGEASMTLLEKLQLNSQKDNNAQGKNTLISEEEGEEEEEEGLFFE